MNIKQNVDQLFSKYLAEQSLDSEIRDLLDLENEIPATSKQSDILFFGINPSYNGEKANKIAYPIEGAVNAYRRYFGPFADLVAEAGSEITWTYMDLFYYRQTKQIGLESLLKKNDGLRFLCDQLILTQQILEWAQPKVIAVCNARAADFFGVNSTGPEDNVWMGYDFKFDQKIGLHRISGLLDGRVNPDLKTTTLIGTPVCFTPTLTYMGQLSKKRLAWHLGFALKQG